MRQLLVRFLLVSLLLAAACQKEDIPLPEGIQTVRGYLQPVPFSLKRRGTHALLTASGGTMIAYAESVTVNLRLLEGQDVELEGLLERNTNPKDSPVFIVQKVLQGSDEPMRPWKIPALGLSLSVPQSWKGTIKGGSATFTVAESAVPPLTVTLRTVAPAASDRPLYGPLPVSSPVAGEELLVVGLRKARAIVNDEGFWVVRVSPAPSDGSETVFTFAPLPVELHLAPYRTILKTMSFTLSGAPASSRSSAAMASSVSPISGGSTSRTQGEGASCGGVAGILCLHGLYCKITDPISESGVCTRR